MLETQHVLNQCHQSALNEHGNSSSNCILFHTLSLITSIYYLCHLAWADQVCKQQLKGKYCRESKTNLYNRLLSQFKNAKDLGNRFLA